MPLTKKGKKIKKSMEKTYGKKKGEDIFYASVNLPTLRDPTTADTPSGSGDIVLFVDAGAGGAKIMF